MFKKAKEVSREYTEKFVTDGSKNFVSHIWVLIIKRQLIKQGSL